MTFHACQRVCLFAWLPAVLLVFAGTPPATADEPATAPSHVARLRFQVNDYLFSRRECFEAKEVVFDREPDYAGGTVIRGVLPVGQGSDRRLAFAYVENVTPAPKAELEEGETFRAVDAPGMITLLLDLNDNFDLTDDVGGVFRVGADIRSQLAAMLFKRVVEGVEVPHVAGMFAFLDFRGRSNYEVRFTGGWVGEIELAGRKWHLAVVDDLDDVFEDEDLFLLTPDTGEKPEYDDPYNPWRLPLPHRLVLDDVCYSVDYAFERSENRTELVVTFTEIAPPTAEVTIKGGHISHLVLQQDAGADATVAAFEKPGPVIRLPAGTYEKQQVVIEGGPEQGWYRAESDEALPVTGPEPVPLMLGSPLRPGVDATRVGPNLALNYTLTGIGGEKYLRYTVGASELMRETHRTCPRFTVSQEGVVLATGTFEYG